MKIIIAYIMTMACFALILGGCGQKGPLVDTFTLSDSGNNPLYIKSPPQD